MEEKKITSLAELVNPYIKWDDSFINDTDILYKTNIVSVNTATDGGFETGLSFLGAAPSAGKTAFATQIAFDMAETNPIFFFELEMNKKLIAARLMSTQTYLNNTADTLYACSTRKLRSHLFKANASDAERDSIRKAAERVKCRGSDFFLCDRSDGFNTVEKIKEKVETYISQTGKKPVVFVDHLHKIEPDKEYVTEKAEIDHKVSTLLDLAHKNDILVFAISEYSKADVNNIKADMSAFSGSRSIIYDADGLYALGFHNTEDLDAERKKEIRDIDFKVIKQRNGAAGGVAQLSFNAKFMYFTDFESSSLNVDDEEPPFEQQLVNVF